MNSRDALEAELKEEAMREAAPEMYAALRYALAVFDPSDDGHADLVASEAEAAAHAGRQPSWEKIERDAVDGMRAALAKAEGRS